MEPWILPIKYRIVIIQRYLPQYRKSFFDLLRKRLIHANAELILIYGSPAKNEAMKQDFVKIDWGYRIDNRRIKIGSRELYWQPCLKFLKGADLIIVEQASKLVLNYILFAGQLLGIKKLCFWGHGKDFKKNSSSDIGEGIKRFMSRHVHWWFVYNDLSAEILQSLGYPKSRITSIQNAIDTRRLIQEKQKIAPQQLGRIRRKAGITGSNVCIYSGGIYPEKRPDFLLAACLQIREVVPDFEIIFIGAGPEDNKIKEAAEKFEWIHYPGPKFEEEKVPYFMLCKLFLIPGAVGLAILDAFALETPLITTNIPGHGPEMDYLIDGVNGIIVRESLDPSMYASQVSHLLGNDKARQKLVAGCRAARGKYTLEAMVERFARGVIMALQN